jgi:hypothetical protein
MERTRTNSLALLLRGMIFTILASVFRLATGKKLRRLSALRFLHVVIPVGMVALRLGFTVRKIARRMSLGWDSSQRSRRNPMHFGMKQHQLVDRPGWRDAIISTAGAVISITTARAFGAATASSLFSTSSILDNWGARKPSQIQPLGWPG